MTADPRTTAQLRRALVALERRVAATSARRRDLPAGSSRSRVTTANARWATACEARDRVQREVELRADQEGPTCDACGDEICADDIARFRREAGSATALPSCCDDCAESEGLL